MRRFSKRIRTIDTVLFTLLLICGCTSSADLISGVSVEDKVARLKLGKTDKAAVEGIFGVEHGNDRNRWTYNFADRQFQIFDRRQGSGVGALPITAGVVPVNTRALVTLDFSEAGVVKQIGVARFFEEPFINDYWYMVKETTKNPLESVASMGEAIGFRIAGLDKSTGSFTLEDPNSKARIAVKLDGQILRVTSRNPHNRLGNEYRTYTKRESAFTNSIGDSEIVQ